MLCIVLCFALGIGNIFHASFVVPFSIVCLYVSSSRPRCYTLLIVFYRVFSFVIIFIEIPLLLRICPTSPKFDVFIRKFSSNYMRAAIYAVMSAVQWLSIWQQFTSLVVAAVFLLIAAIFYALAGLKGQEFQGSKTLGGQGVAQMII